ncbi:MAG: hypothetical protein H6891_05825 [Brucellaceae bacterium]|nr:hypothetical protein [Brucellaceae bacterium]
MTDDPVAKLRKALRGKAAEALSAAAALDPGPVDLPGPTGEANALALAPRGTVLCLGPGDDLALDQAVQALAIGNRVVMASPTAQKQAAAAGARRFRDSGSGCRIREWFSRYRGGTRCRRLVRRS